MCNLLSELETRVQFPEPLTYFHSINILLRRCNHAFSLVTSAASEKMGELRLIPQSGLLSASQPSKPQFPTLQIERWDVFTLQVHFFPPPCGRSCMRTTTQKPFSDLFIFSAAVTTGSCHFSRRCLERAYKSRRHQLHFFFFFRPTFAPKAGNEAAGIEMSLSAGRGRSRLRSLWFAAVQHFPPNGSLAF